MTTQMLRSISSRRLGLKRSRSQRALSQDPKNSSSSVVSPSALDPVKPADPFSNIIGEYDAKLSVQSEERPWFLHSHNDRAEKFLRQPGGMALVDKKKGYTSRRFANGVLQHLLQGADPFALPDDPSRVLFPFEKTKLGHVGILDPMCTGALPVVWGKATKLADHIPVHDGKRYLATIVFGVGTDTLDAEGEETERSELPSVDLFKDKVFLDDLVARYTGEITQKIPVYSAHKVDGERMFTAVRSGHLSYKEALRMAPTKHVFVDSLDFKSAKLSQDKTKVEAMHLDVVVRQGAFIRQLGVDLAAELGARGHVTSLRRVRTGSFSVPMAEFGQETYPKNDLQNKFVPGFDHTEALVGGGSNSKLVADKLPEAFYAMPTHFPFRKVFETEEELWGRVKLYGMRDVMERIASSFDVSKYDWARFLPRAVYLYGVYNKYVEWIIDEQRSSSKEERSDFVLVTYGPKTLYLIQKKPTLRILINFVHYTQSEDTVEPVHPSLMDDVSDEEEEEAFPSSYEEGDDDDYFYDVGEDDVGEDDEREDEEIK